MKIKLTCGHRWAYHDTEKNWNQHHSPVQNAFRTLVAEINEGSGTINELAGTAEVFCGSDLVFSGKYDVETLRD